MHKRNNMVEKFNFEKIKSIRNTDRYETHIATLKAKDRETEGIEKAVEESLRNISNGEKSFVIYGDPQSGKTEMMIALTAKLLDEGHNLIIHLITDNVSLLNQNLRRFSNSGMNPTPKNFDSILDDNIDMQENEWVIFCKKNSSNLKNLLEKLKNIPGKIIIDDEADYATPNSKIRRDEKSKINLLTGQLLGEDGIYIGVTATPARLDVNNTHNNHNQKWVCFSPHSKYTGPNVFFPLEEKDIGYSLRIIPEEGDIYIHLEKSLIRFFINVAYLNLFKNDSEKKYSFLIHNSGKTEDHTLDEKVVHKILNILRDKRGELAEKYYEEIFNEAETMYPENGDAITSYIAENIGKNDVIVMNSKKAKREDSQGAKPPALFTIIIGGNIISRGVTFENLLSMFFTREVKGKFQQDTYIQRARMFGARGEYLEFFELTIPEALYSHWHDCFLFHRLSLESIKNLGQPPTWVYGNRTIPTSLSGIDTSTVHTDSGEMGFGMFEYDSEKDIDDIIVMYARDAFEAISKLKEKYGGEVFPEFLVNYMKLTPSINEIKLSKQNVSGWSDVLFDTLTRPKGFISTSGNFYDYSHHIRIITDSKSKKAKIYYKPTSNRLAFLINKKVH